MYTLYHWKKSLSRIIQIFVRFFDVKYEIVKVQSLPCFYIKFTCIPGCFSSSRYLLISSSLQASLHTLGSVGK